MERDWQHLLDEIDIGEEIGVAYVVDGQEITAGGFYHGLIRTIEADGKHHWRICLLSWSGAYWSVRTRRIVGIERILETA